tara:strand:- start:34 stop:825 length:792 start_codon:yes stop_codon:yes gene_type:complete
MKNKYSIFINSCDNTSDVARHFLMSFDKFIAVPKNIPIFFGTNNFLPQSNHLIKPIKSKKSNWREETIAQLEKIKINNPNITHTLFFLDDFIFSQKFLLQDFHNLFDDLMKNNIRYFRLTSIEESLLTKFFRLFTIKKNFIVNKNKLIQIRKSHPYYCSLQIAFWDIEYLITLLKSSHNIWQFERQQSETIHYCPSYDILSYKHIVEKGEWLFYAKNYCLKNINYFNPGNRNFSSNKTGKYHYYFKKLQFLFFGFLPLRLLKK